MLQKILNSEKGESFLSPPECLWGSHSPMLSIKYPPSPGIKRPICEPNSSPLLNAQVMLLSKNFR